MTRSATQFELLASVSHVATDGSSSPRAEPTSPPSSFSPTPAPTQVLAQLERILTSNAFDASARNRAFLRYVVNETLAGRADRIKGYTVAQEVFQRDADFDPQLDPVVRIEASRLRRSLERYYLTAGRGDGLGIEMPKGGYVPTFEMREQDDQHQSGEVETPREAGAATAAAGWAGPFVVVRRFESLNNTPPQDSITLGLADEIIGCLTHYDRLTVIAEQVGAQSPSLGAAKKDRGHGAVTCYVLQGSTRWFGSRIRVTAQLLDLSDGRYLWVRTFDRLTRSKNLWALQEDIADTIAKAIAGPEGALATLASR
jgi:adenylate cyclase